MKEYSTIIALLLLCIGCSRGKYYISDIFRKNETGNLKIIELDSSYQFYLRQVYRAKNAQQENILKTNLTGDEAMEKMRIEVEYLLVSGKHRSVIYISTIPDKYQHYYSKNFIADTILNAYDFSTFHFGKIAKDGQTITFGSTAQKQNIIWDIRPFINWSSPKSISIREIAVQENGALDNVILINRALEEPIVFARQNNYSIVFEKPGWKADTCNDASMLHRLNPGKIYLRAENKGGYDIFFHFDKSIGKSKDSAIRFDSRRTRYYPADN